jgi:DNA-directed RNA polymerase specialized sigma24 family protein
MADGVGVVGLRGDEAELFRVFNDELVCEIGSYVIHDDPDVIVDACAFAWAQFLQHQPDREENWRGWLFRTASRQAWRLVREERRGAVDRVSLGSGELAGVVSLVDEIEARQDVVDALSVLSRLDVRLQRVALLRALGLKHAEIAQLTGESRTRVDRLLVRAHEAIREVLDERRRGRLGCRSLSVSLRRGWWSGSGCCGVLLTSAGWRPSGGLGDARRWPWMTTVLLSVLSGLPLRSQFRRRSQRFGNFTLVPSARSRNTRLCLIEVASSRS